MNFKMEQIEKAEDTLEELTNSEKEFRKEAMKDNVIDAEEQAVLDRIKDKIDGLRGVVKKLRATIEENKRIWEDAAGKYSDWQNHIQELKGWGQADLAVFEKTGTDIKEALADQRWADATSLFDVSTLEITPVYAEFQAQTAPAMADAAAGDTAPGDAPAVKEALPEAPGAAAEDVGEDKWKAAFEAFKSRLATLEKHAKSGANPEIKPKIDAIKAKRDTAVAKATADDFKAALKLITPLVKVCDMVEDLAHDFAHYEAILSQRDGLVTPNIGVNTGVADVDKLQRKIEDLLTKAKADATAGKFKDGVKKLDQILPLHEKMKVTVTKEGEYQGKISDHDPRIAALGGLPANVRTPIQKPFVAFKKTYESGKFAKTKDYVVSMQIIGPLARELGYFERTTASAQSYLTALTPFETQLSTFEAHKGRVGIEEFYLGMKGDHDQAKTDAAANRHPSAVALLDRTKTRWPAQKLIADECLAYITKREAVAKTIEEVRKNPAAEEVLKQADTLMATAATQALAKDHKAALASVSEAEKRANDAKAAAGALDQMGKLKDEGVLGSIGEDFDAAFKVFTDMKALVVSKDSGSDFTALIAKSDDPAQKAKDEKAKAAPDFAAARGHLDAAIAILEGVLPKVLAFGPFTAHLATAKTLVDTTLPPLNVDDCIKAAIAACKKLVTDAEALAKPEGYDFAGGEIKLSEAIKLGQAAETNAAKWPAIKADKATTKTAADAIVAEPTVVPLMTVRSKRLGDIMTEVDKLVVAGDFSGAAAKAKEGASLGAPTTADIAMCKKILKNKKNWVDDRIAQIQGAGKDPAKDALAETNSKLASYQTNLDAGNFAGAESVLNEIYWTIQAGIDAIAGNGTFEPARAIAEAKIKLVADIRNAAVEEALSAIEARYTAAVAKGADNNYYGAEPEVKAIATECDALLVLATAFKGYDDARILAEAKLTEAEGHEQAAAIQTVLVRLRGKYDNAVALATGGDPATAQKMMEEITPAAEEAINNADNSAIFAGVTEYIGDSASDEGPSMIHIAAAKTAIEWQARKENADVAKAELDEARAQLATADSSATAPGDAKTALQASMDAVTLAGQIISQHELLAQEVEAAKLKIAELKSHAQKDYIAAKIAELEAAVEAVIKLATDAAKITKASADLEAAMAGFHDTKAKADAQVKYLALLAKPEVGARLDVLERHDHSYAIQANIDAMRKKLTDAAAKSAALDPEPAVTLLEEVKALGVSSLVLADMRANTPPDVKDVKEILARPDGQAELDAMLDVLEPDARRTVLRVAFEARFGCDLENFSNGAKNPDGTYSNPIPDGALEAPNIKRFYEIMSDLPDEDTVGNDSMRSFTMIESGQGSVYSSTKKAVVMREGDDTMSGAYSFGQEFQVGEVEDDYKPANDEPVKYFSWNTLHEVGHAVDDKLGFMKKNGSGANYGGWKAYGRNVQPIADAAAKEFEYDPGYIGQILAGNANPALPEKPKTCTAEEWESRRVKFTAWLGLIKSTSSPWASNAGAQKIAIGGIVYQESQPDSWSSYELAARSKGITAYQFRAPGEWFSEMYAAFHSGKLKPAHPAAKWLAGL